MALDLWHLQMLYVFANVMTNIRKSTRTNVSHGTAVSASTTKKLICQQMELKIHHTYKWHYYELMH